MQYDTLSLSSLRSRYLGRASPGFTNRSASNFAPYLRTGEYNFHLSFKIILIWDGAGREERNQLAKKREKSRENLPHP